MEQEPVGSRQEDFFSIEKRAGFGTSLSVRDIALGGRPGLVLQQTTTTKAGWFHPERKGREL